MQNQNGEKNLVENMSMVLINEFHSAIYPLIRSLQGHCEIQPCKNADLAQKINQIITDLYLAECQHDFVKSLNHIHKIYESIKVLIEIHSGFMESQTVETDLKKILQCLKVTLDCWTYAHLPQNQTAQTTGRVGVTDNESNGSERTEI